MHIWVVQRSNGCNVKRDNLNKRVYQVMSKNAPRTSFCNHLKGKTSFGKFGLVRVLIEKDNAIEVAWTCTCKNVWIIYNIATIQNKNSWIHSNHTYTILGWCTWKLLMVLEVYRA